MDEEIGGHLSIRHQVPTSLQNALPKSASGDKDTTRSSPQWVYDNLQVLVVFRNVDAATRSTMLMVLYRGFTRIVRLPELEGGKFFEWSIFIPTSWGYSSTRARGPSNIDRERIQTFVDVANSLIKDDARRDGGGFKLSEPDFKFKRIPDWGVSRPLLASRELKVC